MLHRKNHKLLTTNYKLFTLTTIGIISDTHHWLDENVHPHFADCDEIWHAGDFGDIDVANLLKKHAKANCVFRGVYGNIDGQDIRAEYPEQIVFMCEEVKVLMRHIGGAPPKYNPDTKKELQTHRPNLFVSGHSHILKIMYDDKIGCLHINPGAAGKQGWHKMRTIVKFVVDANNMKDCKVIELGKR